MFKKATNNINNMTKSNEIEPIRNNHISQGTKIKGEIFTDGDLRIDGVFEGTVEVKGKLVLGSESEIKGDIKCKNANVSGLIQGNFNIIEMVSIKSTTKFKGDMVYSKMSVEPGAKLEGVFTLNKNIDPSKVQNENQKEKK